MRLSLTPKARKVMEELKRDNPEIHVILGDTGCCGFSNVFVTSASPGPYYEYLGEDSGARVYVHPAFRRSIDPDDIGIDAIEVEADDSFSIETTLGYRFILRPKVDVKL